MSSTSSQGYVYLSDGDVEFPAIGGISLLDPSIVIPESEEKVLLEPIAIIGLSLRMPGDAVTEDRFWDMLIQKRCVSAEFPEDRINIDAYHSTDQNITNKIPTKRAHFLKKDIQTFDEQFFSMSPVEVAAMDPQQKGLLETTYLALENAGISMEKARNSNTSVHVGSFTTDFQSMMWKDIQNIPKYIATGSAASMLSNRLSWFFNLHGPSITVDTACSSSMVALDLSCNALRSGNADMGVVAGSSLILSPEMNIALANMNFLSPDGRCYSFDHRANGYARGEGFGVLILKRLSQAINDGDNIRTVIRSSGTNQDGHTSGGITQPSKDSQVELINRTYLKAGLNQRLTRYFEAHGTGTLIGDPLEAEAIGESFKIYRSKDDPLYVGAVKSNIGHLEGASGLAGVIKTILVLEKGMIPPNANFEKLNPNIDVDSLNIRFPSACLPWPGNGIRRASVNSFGFGGTNAHVVLENAHHFVATRKHADKARSNDSSSEDELSNLQAEKENLTVSCNRRNCDEGDHVIPRLLIWSANDNSTLRRLTTEYKNHFKALNIVDDDETYLRNLAFTLSSRRSLLPWRAFAVIDFPHKLSCHDNYAISAPIYAPAKPRLGFVFTGQGSQWYAMGRELLALSAFRGSILRSQQSLLNLGCSWLLLDELLRDKENSNVNSPTYSQAMITAIQISLVDLFHELGVVPSIVLGHSSGEIAAAYCSGSICAESAIKLAYHRGMLVSKLMESSPQRYGMASVGLSSAHVNIQLEDMDNRDGFDSSLMTISCINSPQNVTISGPETQIDQLIASLQQSKIFARKLVVGVGYHSSQMSKMAAEYMQRIEPLHPGTTSSETRMISSVSGKIVLRSDLCNSKYWAENLVLPVNFLDALRYCYLSPEKVLDDKGVTSLSADIWVELGPHATLQGPVRDILSSLNRSGKVKYLPSLVRGHPDLSTYASTCGQLHCLGVEIDIEKWNKRCSVVTSPPKVLSTLPPYPFSHSVTHFDEPKLSRELRFPLHSRNDLLGKPTPDWNNLKPTWKLIIRPNELAWVKDHKVNGLILYPAAGMLVMAIEAIRQIDTNATLVGYEIKEVQFHTALVIPDTPAGIATQITLHPSSANVTDWGAWYEFRIYTDIKSNGECTEVCRGHIRGDHGRTVSDVDGGKEEQYQASHIKYILVDAVESCKTELEPSQLYSIVQNCGLHFGSTFQRLNHIHVDGHDRAIAQIGLGQLKDENWKAMSQTTPVIHPTTLDAAFQMIFAALSQGISDGLQTMVPSRIGKLWISNTPENNNVATNNQSYQAFCKVEALSKRSTRGSILVCTPTEQNLRVRVDELDITCISSSEKEHQEPQICYDIKWNPDLDLLSGPEIRDLCERACIKDINDEPIQWRQDLEYVSLAFGFKSLGEINKIGGVPSNYLKRYIVWMETQLKMHDNTTQLEDTKHLSQVEYLGDPERLRLACERLSKSKMGKVFILIGDCLTRILRGEVDPLQLLFDDEHLLEDFYDEMNEAPNYFDPLAKYLAAITHKTPDMKLLEIGAGTGATTKMIHKALAPKNNHPRYGSYDFTDISPSFFSKARETIGNRLMNFKVLDIEVDPTLQAFADKTYDIIFAANVLHATKDLKVTLQNVRKVLKPGGKLILLEVTVPTATLNGFVFGLLPGWWLGVEDYRQQSPCITEEKWDEVLQQSGYSGTDVVFRDFVSAECHGWSIMISTAIHDTMKLSFPRTKIVLDETSLFQQQVAEELLHQLNTEKGSAGFEVTSLQEVALTEKKPNQHYIVLCELDRPVLWDVTFDDFSAVKSLFSTSRILLWMTSGGGEFCKSPDYAVIQGLSRVARQEYTNIAALVTVALEPKESLPTGQAPILHATHIAKIFRSTVSAIENGSSFEPEYLQFNGTLNINRLVENDTLDKHLLESTTLTRTIKDFGYEAAIKLTIGSPGMLDSLVFEKDESYEQTLQPDEIQVQVAAIGVNFKECLTVLGRVDSDRLGSECAGVITRIGSNCKTFCIGDRVTMGTSDTYRTYARAHQSCAVKIPDYMSFTEAAAIPVTFCTAYYSLCEVARLQRNEKILIHMSTGGTGQAAVQLAQYIGAEIFATVGTEAKKDFLIKDYNIPEDHIFYSRNTSFAHGVMRMTDGRGVDVVLNSVSGEALIASWECIAPFGRFLEIGRKDIDSHGSLPMFPFIKNVSFSGVDLAAIFEQKPDLVQQMLKKILILIEDKVLAPAHPLTICPISETEQAFRLLQSGKSIGKIILEISKTDKVWTLLKKDPSCVFRNDVTYLISGGLGGLGRMIARWLVERGARHLLLLSRSGSTGTNQKAKNMLAELRAKGIIVETPVCDVCDMLSLVDVLKRYESTMPPIKGAFLSQMVIEDSTIASMSHYTWKAVTTPKIQGSWNLHNALPKGLDHFIILSSVTGTFGNAGQGNYAAGNSYQDALAAYRLSCGEKAFSLDLGPILTEGYVAENAYILEHLMRLGLLLPMTPERLIAMLDYYCNPTLPPALPIQAQVLSGWLPHADIEARGYDIPSPMQQPIFGGVNQNKSREYVSLSQGETKVVYKTALASAKSPEEASLLVAEALKLKLCRIVGMAAENVELHRKIDSYGVDSLVAVELRNWLHRDIDVDFTVFELVGDATFLSIGEKTVAKSFRQ